VEEDLPIIQVPCQSISTFSTIYGIEDEIIGSSILIALMLSVLKMLSLKDVSHFKGSFKCIMILGSWKRPELTVHLFNIEDTWISIDGTGYVTS